MFNVESIGDRLYYDCGFGKMNISDAIKKPKTPNPLYWIGLAVVMVFCDYFLGPFIQFPFFYLIPVALASWYNGRWWGFALAVAMPLVRLYFVTQVWHAPWEDWQSATNAAIRMLVFTVFAFLINRLAGHERELQREVRVLEGMLPICSFCKKIRDESNKWQPLEKYVSERSEAQFSHGFCPECGEKHYGFVSKPTIPKA